MRKKYYMARVNTLEKYIVKIEKAAEDVKACRFCAAFDCMTDGNGYYHSQGECQYDDKDTKPTDTCEKFVFYME